MNKLVSQDLSPQQFKEMYANLADKEWRMNNLYWIKNKQGIVIPFRRNPIQQMLMTNLSNRNIVVKSRQPGVSTGFMIDYLDTAVFLDNVSIGIIAHKLDIAGNFLDTMNLAYDMLPEILKENCKKTSDVKSRELSFDNGSSIYVSTSFRGSATQFLHISEMGYICKKNPDKAKEIVTGALESVAVDQVINIESTLMGLDGYFPEQVKLAWKKQQQNEILTELDYKLFFFPWMDDPTCVMSNADTENVIIYPNQVEYFTRIEQETNRKITRNQKAYYVKKAESLGDEMKQEYPSTLKEAMEVSFEGTYYADQFVFLRANNRICSVPYQDGVLVDVAWDIGLDGTALWFNQTVGREHHIIDYLCLEDLKYGLIYDEVMKKGYRLGTHILPHDANDRLPNSGLSKVATITNLFQTRNFFICPKPAQLSRADGIQAAKSFFSLCWFDKIKCETPQSKDMPSGLDALEGYSKVWNSSLGRYIDEPRHDKNSHPADSWRHLSIYKMLMMKIGNRQDRQTMNEVMKNPKKTMQGGFKGFI